jgi:hypothetical protein
LIRPLVAVSIAGLLGHSVLGSHFSEILTSSYDDGRALTTDVEVEFEVVSSLTSLQRHISVYGLSFVSTRALAQSIRRDICRGAEAEFGIK